MAGERRAGDEAKHRRRACLDTLALEARNYWSTSTP
jgi:hypothetical protein